MRTSKILWIRSLNWEKQQASESIFFLSLHNIQLDNFLSENKANVMNNFFLILLLLFAFVFWSGAYGIYFIKYNVCVCVCIISFLCVVNQLNWRNKQRNYCHHFFSLSRFTTHNLSIQLLQFFLCVHLYLSFGHFIVKLFFFFVGYFFPSPCFSATKR